MGFHDKKMLRKGSLCICLAAIILDSVGKIKNYYYPLVLLEKCKYKEKWREKPDLSQKK